MLHNVLTDPANTQVTTLALNHNDDLEKQLRDKCASAAAIGFQLATAFPHADTGRLVLIFQKPLPRA